MEMFGGNEIITYLCTVVSKDIDYARDTEDVWNEYFGMSVKDEDF